MSDLLWQKPGVAVDAEIQAFLAGDDVILDREAVRERYAGHYADEPLVRVHDEAPWVSDIAGRHHVDLGGFTLSEDGHRLVVVATEDNLLKGAATQALQNLNLAFGFKEFEGIPA